MSIRYDCARCGAHYEVEDRFGGTKARCAKCFQNNVVPMPRSAAADESSQNDETRESPALPRDVRRACVECGEDMASNATVCVHCGYDTRTGKRLVTEAPSVPDTSPRNFRELVESQRFRDGVISTLVIVAIAAEVFLIWGGIHRILTSADPGIRDHAGMASTGLLAGEALKWIAVIIAAVIAGVAFQIHTRLVAKTIAVVVAPIVVTQLLLYLIAGASFDRPSDNVPAFLVITLLFMTVAAWLLFPLSWVKTAIAAPILGLLALGVIVGQVVVIGLTVKTQPAALATDTGQPVTLNPATPPSRGPTPPLTADSTPVRPRAADVIIDGRAYAATDDPNATQPVPKDAPRWSVDATADDLLEAEVSTEGYRFRPPRGAKAALNASDRTWEWRGPARPGGAIPGITIHLETRRDASLHRPSFLADSQAGRTRYGANLVISATPPAVQQGWIGDLGFTRYQFAGSPDASYIAADGPSWIVIDVKARDADEELSRALFASVASFRRAGAEEPYADPLPADAVAAQLEGDQRDQARDVLIKKGRRAEVAVIPYVTHEKNEVRAAAIAVLGKIGSQERALPLIREAARDKDSGVADAARAAWKSLAPSEFDDARAIIVDLGSPVVHHGPQSIARLKRLEPDDRRDEMAAALNAYFATAPRQPGLLEQLGRWGNDQTRAILVERLTDPKTTAGEAREFAKVIVALGGEPALPALVRAMAKDLAGGDDILAPVGPPVEDELIKLLRDRDEAVVRGAVRLLGDLGTEKSLVTVRALMNSRDPAIQEAARVARDKLEQRQAQNIPSPLIAASKKPDDDQTFAGVKFGDVASIGGWAVLPPAGMRRDNAREQRGELIWVGKAVDGVASEFSLHISQLETPQQEPTVLNAVPAGGPRTTGATVIMPGGTIDQVRIANVKFTRIARTTTDTPAKREYIMVAILNRTTFIRITGVCAASNPEMIKALDAAARTLKRARAE
jgi:HEAT repeat protein